MLSGPKKKEKKVSESNSKENTNRRSTQTSWDDRLKNPGQGVLALIIVVGAFILILVMLSIQNSVVVRVSDNTDKIFTGNMTVDQRADTMTQIITTIDKSNQVMFNVLVPVFAAWVGGVVAYYFGSKQAKEALDSQKDLVKKLGLNDNMLDTVEDLLKWDEGLSRFPVVTINDYVDDDFETKIENKGFAIVKFEIPKSREGDNQYPMSCGLKTYENKKDEDSIRSYFNENVGDVLGVLYESDIYGLTEYKELKKEHMRLWEIITNYEQHKSEKFADENPNDHRIVDTITNRVWTIDPTASVENFAEVYEEDTLKEAKGKVVDVGNNPDNAKGIVLNDNGTIVGVISSHDILTYL